jgi:hypothetical protein
MSRGPKLTFRGITRTIFARLCKKASKIGIHVVGPTGEAVKDGIKLRWNYDVTLEQLEVQCIHTPFWIDSVRVNSDLRYEIENVLDHDRAA